MAKDGVGYKIVCIGGSAGSLEVILQIISALPHHANAAYVIIVHRKNDPDSLLESLLASKTKMKVKEVEDKEPIYLNTVYIAPPDYHLLFEDEQTILDVFPI